MDLETQQRIEETVLEILKDADMEVTTEFTVRSMASEKLGLDLSLPDRKRFVRQVVENFLQSKKDAETQQQQQQQQQGVQVQEPAQEEEDEEEEEVVEEGGKRKREYDDEGNLIICRLSSKRQETVQDFRGKMLVSIREYYEKDGKQMLSSKGMNFGFW